MSLWGRGRGGLIEWDWVKRKAKNMAPLKTSDHICKMLLYSLKKSTIHPSFTVWCTLVGKMHPSQFLVLWDNQWLSTLQINGWVKEGWFLGLPFTWPQPIIFFFFEIIYRTKCTHSDIAATVKRKNSESYNYISSRRTKVNMLTAELQVECMLRYEQNSYWNNTRDKKCTISWKSQLIWFILQSARLCHQKWQWLKLYVFQKHELHTKFHGPKLLNSGSVDAIAKFRTSTILVLSMARNKTAWTIDGC
jgi:hypothetical protein